MLTSSPIDVLAYYFPQYHPDPRNDQRHGKDWTEWELVKAAAPRFPGHRQPIVPALGYLDESNPVDAAKEIDLAADHGITGFLFDWYWYEDGPFLEGGLEKGFLGAANRNRLNFALMWANHDWHNIHPANYLNRPATLSTGRVSPQAFQKMTQHIISNLFSQPNCLKVNGAPYFSIYELSTFVDGMGSIAAAKEALDAFRKQTQNAGFPGLHLNAIDWGVNSPAFQDNNVLKELGVESTTSYVWIHHYDLGGGSFPKGSYQDAMAKSFDFWKASRNKYGITYSPNVTMGWDPSPRTAQTDRYENRGYPFTAILEGNTPERFQEALAQAKEFVLQENSTPRIVTLNAWNEWTEGSYLLPDTQHGTAYLEAIRAVFGVKR